MFTNDPVMVTYVGDFSGVECMELGVTIERGVPFEAPAEFASRMIGLRPTQWECEDEDVLAAAAVIQEAEAAALEVYNEQFLTDDEKEAKRILGIKTDLDIPIEEP